MRLTELIFVKCLKRCLASSKHHINLLNKYLLTRWGVPLKIFCTAERFIGCPLAKHFKLLSNLKVNYVFFFYREEMCSKFADLFCDALGETSRETPVAHPDRAVKDKKQAMIRMDMPKSILCSINIKHSSRYGEKREKEIC